VNLFCVDVIGLERIEVVRANPVLGRKSSKRACIYAYPLELPEATRGAQSVNRFTHVARFPRPDIPQIVWPNAETLTDDPIPSVEDHAFR
jgi:hypothetical protein